MSHKLSESERRLTTWMIRESLCAESNLSYALERYEQLPDGSRPALGEFFVDQDLISEADLQRYFDRAPNALPPWTREPGNPNAQAWLAFSWISGVSVLFSLAGVLALHSENAVRFSHVNEYWFLFFWLCAVTCCLIEFIHNKESESTLIGVAATMLVVVFALYAAFVVLGVIWRALGGGGLTPFM